VLEPDGNRYSPFAWDVRRTHRFVVDVTSRSTLLSRSWVTRASISGYHADLSLFPADPENVFLPALSSATPSLGSLKTPADPATARSLQTVATPPSRRLFDRPLREGTRRPPRAAGAERCRHASATALRPNGSWHQGTRMAGSPNCRSGNHDYPMHGCSPRSDLATTGGPLVRPPDPTRILTTSRHRLVAYFSRHLEEVRFVRARIGIGAAFDVFHLPAIAPDS